MHFEKALERQREAGFSVARSQIYGGLAQVRLDSGDLEKARTFAGEALELAQNGYERANEAGAMVRLGSILGKTGPSQSEKAEEYILQGIRILDELQLKPLCSQGYLYLGELYADTGQREKAIETLKKAEAAFREMGMDHPLRRTQEVLERVEG